MITKRYHSVSYDIKYIQGKLALLHKAKERAMSLLLSAIEAFKKAELRYSKALAVESPSVTPCDSDDDDDSYSGFESTSDDED